MEDTKNKIFYSSYSDDYSHPGDRRRFYGFLKKKNIEKSLCTNYKDADILFITNGNNTDLSIFYKYLKNNNKKLIFELCDAYLSEPFTFNRIFRSFYKFIKRENKYFYPSQFNLIKKICKMADIVICASENQKNRIMKFNKNVFVIYDFLDTEIYNNTPNHSSKKKTLNIFWEGQSNNIQEFNDVIKVLKIFNKRRKIKMHFVTDNTYMNNFKIKEKTITYIERNFSGIEYELFKWSIKNLNEISQNCDLAVIPCSNKNRQMFRDKSANKLHILWKLGLPTITSSNDAYKKSMNAIGIDMICQTDQDWIDRLNFCCNNNKLIKKDIIKAKEFLNNNYSDEKIMKRWDKVFSKFMKI